VSSSTVFLPASVWPAKIAATVKRAANVNIFNDSDSVLKIKERVLYVDEL